jgi:hypothetical protein
MYMIKENLVAGRSRLIVTITRVTIAAKRVLKMKRSYLEATILTIMLPAIVVLAAYPYLRAKDKPLGKEFSQRANDRGYSTDMKELRAKFNRDKGKVRLLLLLSPT